MAKEGRIRRLYHFLLKLVRAKDGKAVVSTAQTPPRSGCFLVPRPQLKFNKNIPYPHTHTPKVVGVGVVIASFKGGGEEGREDEERQVVHLVITSWVPSQLFYLF